MRIIEVSRCEYGECPYFSQEIDHGHGGEAWDRCNKYRKEIVILKWYDQFPEFCELKEDFTILKAESPRL